MGSPGGNKPKGGSGLGGRIAGMGLGVVISLAVAGVVVAQTVFGIEIPVIGKLLGGGGNPSSKSALKKDGINYEAANPNDIIEAMGKRARKWRKDAEFYSVTINGMKTDGTLDFSGDKAIITVEYFSPELVGSSSSSKRKDSIRKYVINKYNLKEEVWGVKKAFPDVPGTPVPKCQLSKVGKTLKDKGMTDKSSATISLDPGFAFATDGLSFNVNVSNPKLHMFLDIDSCDIIKEM